MKRFFRMRFRFVWPVLSLALAGCAGTARPPAEKGKATADEGKTPAAPLVLDLAVNDIYCHDTACSCVYDVAARTYTQTVRRLEADYGIVLRLHYFTDTFQLEDAIASGRYDGAICKPWYAFRNEKKAGARFRRIADLLDPDDNRLLTAIFIVPTNSPIRSLADLTGKRLCIGQPDSYEKHYAALRLLRERNVKPARIVEHNSCSENIGALLDGEVDAAVISDYSLRADCAVDFASPEQFRVIGRTEAIPLTSVMLDLNRVSEADARRLQRALLEISGPSVPASLLGRGFVEPMPWNPPERRAAP